MARAAAKLKVADAKLLLIFTPGLAGADPMAALGAAMPWVDIVQVRPKSLSDRAPGAAPGASVTEARSAFDWCQRVLALRSQLSLERAPLVMVNDRVDVAVALKDEGLDGVHIGTDDMPVVAARELLGDDLLLGLSSHTTENLVRAWDQPIDMLGFGPIFPTATKGYAGGADTPAIVGPERAWIAAESAPVPVFPIGGINAANISQLDRVGRAAVGSAILGAADPASAARSMREALVLK
jgi:thiamine-phosphate diphosphorylase